ncbi:MAG TPA: histidinol dehydrogenase [Gammaproteobacteria bacterium]|nr:histidinol dehydrogenase [Gammaproteobacteria bacterium]
MKIQRLEATDPDFDDRLARLLDRGGEQGEAVAGAVRRILADVRARGDAALLDYCRRFDGHAPDDAAGLEVPATRLARALEGIDPDRRQALEDAAERLRSYAGHQRMQSWTFTDGDGNVLGQQVTALDRVGIYVPGGKAAYPSSVLMNAVPARVAGVGEIVMCVPTPGGALNELVLAAAAVAGVDRVFTLGGAQAVAAMAFGTGAVPAVDKIVGPGNAWVAEAKRQVYGVVGIDMIAGPSEILVVCDGATDPDWIAMDLFAQAEHDEQAQAILVSPDAGFLDRVAESASRLLAEMPRADIIRASLGERGALVHVRDLEQAAALVNRIAPEHLELSLAEPEAFAAKVRHAGAIFMGRHVAEALGDYCAGPNHVLPTSRTARFSSPLGVYDFQKRSSVIRCSPRGAERLGRVAATLARAEGLEAHARSAEYRCTGKREGE